MTPATGAATLEPVATLELDDAEFESIVESREFLETAVSDAELPALLASLALATGDVHIVAERLRPPMPPMEASISPQGGMTIAAQTEARQVAVDALERLRDATEPFPAPTPELLRTVMRFLTDNAGDEYVPLLEHEIALNDTGAPQWHMSEVDPDIDFRVAVIGAGISGISASYRLAQAGVEHTILEKGTEVGGVWWENSYPGCRLDTPNFAYSFSFAQKADWPDQFSTRNDIWSYLHGVAERFGIRDRVRFGTEAIGLTWLEDENLWLVQSRTDGVVTTERYNAVISASGQLSLPSIPEFAGAETFAGAAFHSAEWDHSVETDGMRVAVIGTGASAFQIAPALVDTVGHLTVFQRHAPWMLPTPNYHAAIPQGMGWLLTHVPHYGRCYRFYQFWQAAEGRMPLVEADPEWTEPGTTSAANKKLRDQLLTHIGGQLTDRPDLLPKMTPNYPPGVKRMTRDNGVWANTMKQDHVDLVTSGIERFVPEGIIDTDGVLHEVDVVVYATGFRAADYLEPMTVTGRDNTDLHEMWDGDARAYLGITIERFPNLFMLLGPNTGVVVNGSSLYMAECAAEYVVESLGELVRRGNGAMEPRPEAVAEFCDYVDAGNRRRAWGTKSIETWYQNRHGRASQVWPYSLHEFFRITRTPETAQFTFTGALGSPTATSQEGNR